MKRVLYRVFNAASSSGVINFLFRVKPALRVSGLFRVLVPARLAAKIGETVASLRVPVKPAPRISQVNVGSAFAPASKLAQRVTQAANQYLVPTKEASRLLQQGVGVYKVPNKDAAELVQIRFDLDHRSHVVVAANDATNIQNWSNPTRMQAAPDASEATFAGSAILLASGTLRGTSMVAQTSRPASLIIDEVWLDYYGHASGPALRIAADMSSLPQALF